ncbi:regulator of G-protein signaling 8 isoform X1 [Prionailurus bengalensis]|uniref:regulator of G-protein signaling 8 isoform X1 n=1 Tax=Prionailurus bengalensis TaxID=37029 RepID=UPI001CA9CAA7|nr:regulator of G-protein signaling 8 isoform X1 [Prionailurus bengalensis]
MSCQRESHTTQAVASCFSLQSSPNSAWQCASSIRVPLSLPPPPHPLPLPPALSPFMRCKALAGGRAERSGSRSRTLQQLCQGRRGEVGRVPLPPSPMYQEVADSVTQGLTEPCPAGAGASHTFPAALPSARQNSSACSLSDHPVGKDLQAMRTGQRQNKGMRTRLGCLSHKSDSCSDFTAILPDKPNRALKRLSTEEATRWADSFDVLLSHKYGVAAFRAFLKTEFSEENLEFWLACEEFKKTRSTAKLVSKAHRIFEEFVDVQAPREVNIDFQTREATRKNMQEPSLTCFDQAQGKVHSLMEKDSYPRFLRSKMYLDLLSQSQRRLS